jgi:hypothetical protein
MATQFLDGFDHYAIGDILSKWTSFAGASGNAALGTGRFGGKCLVLENRGSPLTIQKVLPTPLSNLVVGFAFQCTSTTSSIANLVGLYQGSTEQVSVSFHTDGTLVFSRGGTPLSATNASGFTSVTINQWNYVEMQVSVATSVAASTCKIFLNGVLMQTLNTGQSTDPAGSGHASMIALSTCSDFNFSSQFEFDDLYVISIDGVTTGPFGESRIDALYPTAAGSNAGFTKFGGATNWQSVDESTPDGDTTYVTSATNGTIDTYDHGATASTPTTVHAVQVNLWARKDNPGSAEVAPAFVIGGTGYAGTNLPLSSSYQDMTECFDVSIATAVAWTGTEVNAMEVGVKLTS